MLPRLIVMLPSVSLAVVIPVPPPILNDSPELIVLIVESSAPMLKPNVPPVLFQALPS